MTPEKKARIEELAVKNREAFDQVNLLGMWNTWGQTAADIEQHAKDYATATADMLSAAAELRAAQEPE